MKRAAAGQLPLLGAIKKLMAEVMEPPSFDDGGDTDDPLAAEAALLANLKKAALFCSGAATQKYMQALQDQQEIMGDLADMTMQVFALESALLRARKLSTHSQKSQTQTAHAIVKLFAADALAVVEKAARRVLAAVAEGDMLRTQLAILRRLLKHTPEDTIALSRMVAQRQLDGGGSDSDQCSTQPALRAHAVGDLFEKRLGMHGGWRWQVHARRRGRNQSRGKRLPHFKRHIKSSLKKGFNRLQVARVQAAERIRRNRDRAWSRRRLRRDRSKQTGIGENF